MSATAALQTIVRYPKHTQFHRDLRAAVNSYFDERGISKKGDFRMLRKSAVLMAWFAVSYVLLLLWASTWWQVLLLAASAGLAVAGIGFSIGHDGVHGAYARGKWGNRIAGWSFDLVGASSYFWHYKHDILHHQFTNIETLDQDIAAEPFLRLSPSQKRRWYHRWQHLYALFIYGFLVIKWNLYDDFHSYVRGRVGVRPVPRPRGLDLVVFLGGKLGFVALIFVIPFLLHPFLTVVGVYLFGLFVAGVTLSTVFQLAHVVEGTSYFKIPEAGNRMDMGWAEHQLATTADFCPRNRFLRWYIGGLNYQIEHHLFARICHVHYPALQPIVQDVCKQWGVAHHTNQTLLGAIYDHLHLLRRLGLKDAEDPSDHWCVKEVPELAAAEPALLN